MWFDFYSTLMLCLYNVNFFKCLYIFIIIENITKVNCIFICYDICYGMWFCFVLFCWYIVLFFFVILSYLSLCSWCVDRNIMISKCSSLKSLWNINKRWCVSYVSSNYTLICNLAFDPNVNSMAIKYYCNIVQRV